jgi:serine/threonine-protein kinase
VVSLAAPAMLLSKPSFRPSLAGGAKFRARFSTKPCGSRRVRIIWNRNNFVGRERVMGLGGLFKSILSSSRTDVQARYELLRAAVSGTMSKFYKARDRQTDQIVGLKILDPKKTEQLEARFKGIEKPSEGEIAVQFKHPNIVETYEYGLTTSNEQYLVMEFLDGPGLNSLVIGRDKRLERERWPLLIQAAQALSAVHAAGFIHRDICPRNFVCTPDIKTLKLIDFGLTVPATPQFMQPGNRTGSPNYMAPEVVRRRATDQRLDIFSFGVTAYELLTFELPWQRGNNGQAAMSHGVQEPTPLEILRPRIRPELRDAVMRCLSSDPDKRFPKMDNFLAAILHLKSIDIDE